MAQTLVSLLVHITFSTKDRIKIIEPDVEPDFLRYISGIVRNHKSKCLAINGAEDHIHMLVSLSKNDALSDLLKNIKKDSSSWIKTQGRAYKDFHWQEGYAAFSIGQSGMPALRRYIAGQKEHHKRYTFQSELLGLLERYEIEYDERYIWT
jgi:REP element-mobilizing transposase RayT